VGHFVDGKRHGHGMIMSANEEVYVEG
jgi:hypothetical protein